MTPVIEIVDGIAAVDATQWDALAGSTPLLKHAFLVALEHAHCVGGETGWQSCPMLLKSGDQLLGAVPLYLKYHSYGEYVFDWSWADAHERHGLAYYPKLLAAIPFTPITSARLLAGNDSDRRLLEQGLKQLVYDQKLSSAHVNFPDSDAQKVLESAGWLRRNGVQFRWENHAYESFDAFLMTLSQSKRKKIRQERKKVAAQGVSCRTIKGADIMPEEWEFFFRCYTQTYLEHHSSPYLNLEFFTEIGASMPENIVMFMAYREGEPVASSLCIYDDEALYGRYWGAAHYVSNLHFELCYYQAQAFCIAENIRFFEGGAQGEHKLSRGFIARPTCSFHLIAHPDFSHAIKAALQSEEVGMHAYVNELEARSPFKQSK